jgi:hypothetical protein
MSYQDNNIYDLLQIDKPFLFARYNDGEYIAITQWDYIFKCNAHESPGNCDQHLYYPEMGKVLKEAIESDENKELALNYKYIFQSKLENYILKYTNNFNLDTSSLNNIIFKVPTILNDLTDYVYTEPHKIIDIINIFNNKNTILIGPKYLECFSPLKVKHHIIIPLINCFLDKDNIIKSIQVEMNKYPSCCFIFCASMTTNYIIEKMKHFAIDKHYMIDCGSIFDNFLSKTRFPQIVRRIK